MDELKTLGDIMEWGVSQFEAADIYYGHGTDNAWDEALAIALHVLELPFDSPREILQNELTAEQRKTITDLFKRRTKERVPVPYLTGVAYFAGLPFKVTPDVLIPRSPIAELIMQGFAPWIDPEKITSILDVCTGNGCIAIICALAFPEASVDALDISSKALAVAQGNVAHYELENRLTLHESDLFARLPTKQFDVIVSNPPYVSFDEMTTLPKEFTYEPVMALEAADDGLELVKQILQSAAKYLSEQGILIVEVGNSADALLDAMPEMPFTWLGFENGGDGIFLLTKAELEAYYHGR